MPLGLRIVLDDLPSSKYTKSDQGCPLSSTVDISRGSSSAVAGEVEEVDILVTSCFITERPVDATESRRNEDNLCQPQDSSKACTDCLHILKHTRSAGKCLRR